MKKKSRFWKLNFISPRKHLFSDRTIVFHHQPDLKTSFPSVCINVETAELIFKFWLLTIFAKSEISILLWHFFELYLTEEGINPMTNARFGLFRSSRVGLKKISWKNIKFQENYGLQEKLFFFSQLWLFVCIDSGARGATPM